jgi:hypothetical protein
MPIDRELCLRHRRVPFPALSGRWPSFLKWRARVGGRRLWIARPAARFAAWRSVPTRLLEHRLAKDVVAQRQAGAQQRVGGLLEMTRDRVDQVELPAIDRHRH